uniref:Uncharacterized protein n=1 Tax=Leersia perrieri TaxID=77586 RepID=A0A0D9WRE3_9ORYZ
MDLSASTTDAIAMSKLNKEGMLPSHTGLARKTGVDFAQKDLDSFKNFGGVVAEHNAESI